MEPQTKSNPVSGHGDEPTKTKTKPRSAKTQWLQIAAIIVGLILIAATGWWFWQRFISSPDDLIEIGDLTTVEDWQAALPKLKTRAEKFSATREDKEKYAQALRVVGDLDGAIKVYEGLDDALNLGNMYRDKAAKAKTISGTDTPQIQEYLDQAVTHYRAAIDQDTENTAAVVNLAKILEDRKQTDAAVKVYKDAIAQATKDVSLEMLKSQLGRLYQRLGKISEAQAIYKEVLQLNPNNQMAKDGLAE